MGLYDAIVMLGFSAFIIWALTSGDKKTTKNIKAKPKAIQNDNTGGEKYNTTHKSEESVIERLHKHRPKEVYILSLIVFVSLFLNITDVIKYSKPKYLFDYEDSCIYEIVRHFGVSNDNASILYIIITALYAYISIKKAKKISSWLWSE